MASRFFQNPPPPIRRLRSAADFAMRRSAIIALALFAVVGLLVLDDYGVGRDESLMRMTGHASLNYLLGDEEALLGAEDPKRFYGVGA